MAFFNEAVNKKLDESSSSFYELKQGDNKFRIVSEFAWGYKYNYENRGEGKEAGYPFYRTDDPKVKEHKMNLTAAMVLYDYESGSLKSFNIHQKKILKPIQGYYEMEEYGDPTGYDIVIKKTGEGRDSDYQVIAKPPTKAPKEILEAMDEILEIKIENVYEGESPIVAKE